MPDSRPVALYDTVAVVALVEVPGVPGTSCTFVVSETSDSRFGSLSNSKYQIDDCPCGVIVPLRVADSPLTVVLLTLVGASVVTEGDFSCSSVMMEVRFSQSVTAGLHELNHVTNDPPSAFLRAASSPASWSSRSAIISAIGFDGFASRSERR